MSKKWTFFHLNYSKCLLLKFCRYVLLFPSTLFFNLVTRFGSGSHTLCVWIFPMFPLFYLGLYESFTTIVDQVHFEINVKNPFRKCIKSFLCPYTKTNVFSYFLAYVVCLHIGLLWRQIKQILCTFK